VKKFDTSGDPINLYQVEPIR